jgi:hypothetical protein
MVAGHIHDRPLGPPADRRLQAGDSTPDVAGEDDDIGIRDERRRGAALEVQVTENLDAHAAARRRP